MVIQDVDVVDAVYYGDWKQHACLFLGVVEHGHADVVLVGCNGLAVAGAQICQQFKETLVFWLLQTEVN